MMDQSRRLQGESKFWDRAWRWTTKTTTEKKHTWS